MGLDYFYRQSNTDELIENRGFFFTKISREKLSRKKSHSKGKNISLKKNIIFKTDLSNNLKTSSFSLDIPEFLNYKRKTNIRNKKENNSLNIIPLSSTASSNSTIEDTKIQNIFTGNINLNTIIDKNENSRKTFYQKLICKNFININKEEIKNNTLFIFDWDDTLFFTTHLNPSKNNVFFFENENEKKMIKVIESYIEDILNKALSKGTVLIITNSSEGWVEVCVKFYYPDLIPILKNIYIISARELYQEQYPTEPGTWKIKAFNDLKEQFNFEQSLVTNIICFGDDKNEIIAAQKLGENINNCLIKTVKFRDKPDLKEMLKQLILINEQILRVYNYPKSLTIQIDKKKNPKN